MLRHIPAVDVDAAGTVSLRGDPNVQILIDGKPSPLMSPTNRAAALEAMAADQIARIEVLTSPPAQYKPDGSTGVINIITKRNRKKGRSGAAQANFGSEGRFNLAVNGAYKAGPVALSLNLSARQDSRKRISTDRRTRFDPVLGPIGSSTQDVANLAKRLSLIETFGIDYDLTARDRFDASATYNDRIGKPVHTEHDTASDAAGAATRDYQRRSADHEREINTQISAKYRHAFPGDDHALTLDYERGETRERQRFDFTNTYTAPAGPPTFDFQRSRTVERVQDLSAEYARPLPRGAKGLIGYDIQRDDDDYDNRGDLVDPATGALVSDPVLTNHFVLRQTIHAVYASYERPVGPVTVIAGLRWEAARVETNQITSATRDGYRYDRLYPSLHLQYDLNPQQSLTFGFSRRVTRPRAEDLNPYPAYQDAFTFRAGNARLLPQDTRSVEIGYDDHHAGASFQATLFGRLNRDVVTDVSRYLTPSVLLITKANLGRSAAAGVDLAASRKFGRILSLTASGTLAYNRIDAGNLGFSGARSLVTANGKFSVTINPTARDQVQLSGNIQGRRLTAQGYRLPSWGANLGFRHTFNNRLSAVATVADVFDTQRDRNVTDIATLRDHATRRLTGRAAFIGLAWAFGGPGKKDAGEAKFDYSNGPP